MKSKKICCVVFICIITIILIFSSYKIISWLKDNKKTKDNINNIMNKINIDEVEDSSNAKVINQENEVEDNNPYWDYIKLNLIDVDFSELKNINNDIVSWIQVNGTNINYPVVQSDNNNFYLNHSIDKSYNEAGWVFMDYRNNPNIFSRNNIFYAHDRLDGTMFGSLKNIIKTNWYNDSSNHIVRVSNEKSNSLWQVFSVYQIPVTSDYIETEFNSDNEYLEWLNMIKKRSIFNFNTSITSNDKIITLSTCHGNDRVVLHAKLIKIDYK